MALSSVDRQQLIEATRQHRLGLDPENGERSAALSIDEIRALIDVPDAVRVIDNGTGWFPNELATVRHVEPKRGRVTIQFGPAWWNTRRCPRSYLTRAEGRA